MKSMNGSAGLAGRHQYRFGWIVASCAAILTVWTTIVRDDGSGEGNLMIVMAVAVSTFSAGFTAAGVARAMLGVAVMTLAMGMLMATDPTTPDVERAILWTGVLALMWLCSAALFHAAGKAGSHI